MWGILAKLSAVKLSAVKLSAVKVYSGKRHTQNIHPSKTTTGWEECGIDRKKVKGMVEEERDMERRGK